MYKRTDIASYCEQAFIHDQINAACCLAYIAGGGKTKNLFAPWFFNSWREIAVKQKENALQVLYSLVNVERFFVPEENPGIWHFLPGVDNN